MRDKIYLQYNEEVGAWEKREEPFAVIECPTKEDYDRLVEMVNFWKEHHKENEDAKEKSDAGETGSSV